MPPTLLDMYTARNCSGAPGLTIDLTTHNESLCAGCWDRCAWSQRAGAKANFASMRVRGPGRIAANGNCVGKYAYAGGWSDATLGGVCGEADGCHEGGVSAVIMCSGAIQGIQDDIHVWLLCRGAFGHPN